MTKRESQLIKRYPRIAGITPKVRLTERILWLTYNSMATKRGHLWQYDLYKTKKGIRAPFNFLLLAKQLVKRKIDPALYLKVMGQYGPYLRATYMPHPTWLASKAALKIFKWKLKSERRKYEREADWKRALASGRESDIWKQVRYCRRQVEMAVETFKLPEDTAVIMLREELSPWYIATHLVTHRKSADALEKLIRSDDRLYASTILCLRHFKANHGTFRKAKKIVR